MSFPSVLTPPLRPRRYRTWDPANVGCFDKLGGTGPLLTRRMAKSLAEVMTALLTDSEVSQQLQGLPNWRRAQTDEPAITATYELTDFVAALDFVNQVGHEAELMNHHPDIDIRWNKVTLVLSTHSEGGLTQNDIELAHRINEVVGQEA
jgi:4a-hydroxytetrahydrobiopterin dehydratase